MNFGTRLKELRQEKNLKQSELADIFGISTSAVGSYERCERQPTFELLRQYADFFSVSTDWILCRSDERLTVEQYSSLDSFDLQELFEKNRITLSGSELTPDDKRRVIDIAVVLLFDRI